MTYVTQYVEPGLWQRVAAFTNSFFRRREIVQYYEEETIESLSVKARDALRRHNAIVIAELQEEISAMQTKALQLGEALDDLVLAFHERAEPLIQQMHDHTERISAVQDLLAQYTVKMRGY